MALMACSGFSKYMGSSSAVVRDINGCFLSLRPLGSFESLPVHPS
jgi:hypothetical protein